MAPTRRRKALLRSLLVVNLLAGTAFWSGCGSDGAGTVHIESSRERRQKLQTGAGPGPTVTGQPGHAGTPGKPAPPASSKNPGRKTH